MKRSKPIVSACVAALFTAFIAILSQIAIYTPSGVPITLQTFAIALSGLVMGVKWGTASVATYILLGAVGLPVFSSFRGGFSNTFRSCGRICLGIFRTLITLRTFGAV